jgi:hypothetical protein
LNVVSSNNKNNSSKSNISFLDYERANSTLRWPVTGKGQHANKITMAIYGTRTKKTQIKQNSS